MSSQMNSTKYSNKSFHPSFSHYSKKLQRRECLWLLWMRPPSPWYQNQWNYSVYYNGGYMSLHICSNPENVQHQEWTLIKLMEIIMGQYRFIDCSKCPLWWRMLIIGEARHVWGQKMYGKSCTLCLILLWTWNCFKKK